MTVAAGIEIVAGGSPPPGPGKVLGVAQGAGRAGVAAGNLLSPTIPGGESFRSGWQSLLASLGSVVEGLSEEGGGAVDAALPAAQPAPGEAAGKASVATPDRLAGAGMRLSQGAGKGSGQAGAAEKLSPAGVRDGAFAHRPAAGAVLHASTRTEERKPAAELLAESAIGRSPAHSGKVARPEAAPVGTLPGPVPATIASVPQSLPAPALAKPVVRTMDAKAQFRQTDLSTSLPTGPLSTPIGPHRLNPYLPGGVAGPANAAVHESTQGTETPEKQGQLPPVPNLQGFSAAVLNPTETPAAHEDAPPPAPTSAQAEKPFEALTPSQNPIPTFAQGENLFEKSAPSQNPIQTLAPSENTIPTFAQGENLFETSAPSQKPMQTLAPSENTIPTFAQGENLFETSAPSQNPVQTLAQGQNQFPVQPGNQGVDVVAASMGSKGLDRLSVAPSAANSQAGRLSQVPPILDKPGSAGGAKPSAFDTLSVTHGAGKFDSVHHGSHLVEGQPAGPGVDVSAMMRELAGARGAMKTAGDTAGGSTAETTGSGPREAFAALDAEGAPGKPAWISAGAQRAEAGFQDPALGWVGVRADLGGGGIHAALVPGSADAAQALGGHLAGLNAYLAEHHTPVGTVTMAAPEGGWAGVGADKGAGQGMQQGAGQQTGQETAGGSDAGSQSGPSPGPTVLPTASSGLPAWSGGLDGTAQAARPGGVHISVMA